MKLQLHLEDGGSQFHHTAGGYTVGADPFWACPNTIPMFRADTRRVYDEAGEAYFHTGDDGGGNYLADPENWGRTLAKRVAWFKVQTASIWPATKTFAWSLMIEGPDGLNTQLHLCRHPDDEIIAGFAVPGVNGRASPFPEAGIAECAEWFEQAAERLAYYLALEHLPYPSKVWGNIESLGDVQGASFIDDGEGGHTAGIWDVALAHTKAATYKIDGTRTLLQWASERTLRPDDSPYPAFDGAYFPGTPENFDVVQRCTAMCRTSFLRALDQGVFRFFRERFGCQCVEWSTISDSRSSPAWAYGFLKGYDMGGYMPLGGACPPMYSYPEGLTNFGGSLDDWASEYGVPASPSSLRSIRAGAGQIVEWAQDIANASGKPVFPSVQLADDAATSPYSNVATTLRAALRHEMAQALISLADHDNGPAVTDVYLYAPDWSTDSATRADWFDIAQRVDRGTEEQTFARSSQMGLSFSRPTHAEMIAALSPLLHVRLGKSTITNVVGGGSAAYAGTPEHGRPCNIYSEALDADNVGTRFVNSGTTPTNYVNLGTVLGTFGSTFFPSGGAAKSFALRLRFKMNSTGRCALFGNQDANNALLVWGGSNKSWIADTNMCQVMVKRDGSNYLSIAVNTGGAHANSEWHTLDLLFDHVNNAWSLIFDDGVASTTTALTNDNTTNPWSLSGSLANFGNFNSSFYVAAHWTGSAVSQPTSNTDIEVAEVLVLSGTPSTANGSPTSRSMLGIGRAAIGFDGAGVYFPESVQSFFQRSQTGHGAMLVFGDSQTTQAKERLAWLGTMNLNLKDSIGVAGTWSAGMVAHQGSYVTSYDGVGRGGIANGTSYASWHADLKALIPDHQITVSDPGTTLIGGQNPSLVNTSAVGLVGGAWVLADGSTVANSNSSTWTWTVAEASFDVTAPLKLHLRVLGSTTGSGAGTLNVVLKNGSDILCASTISTKGPAPAGARTNGIWWEADVALDIPAGARSSSTYTLYGARSELGGSGGSAGPCGISFAQIALATPVGVSPGVLIAEGGRSMRWNNRQLEDVGVARTAAILRAAAQPAIAAGQNPNVCIFCAHGFNDINDANDSLTPDGTFTATASNKHSGIYQNFEWFLRHIDAAAAALGWNAGSVTVLCSYQPSSSDEWYLHNTYSAFYRAAKARTADLSLTQVCVAAMPELLTHSIEFSSTAPAKNFPINDSVHPTRDGFIKFFRTILTSVYAAVSKRFGEATAGGGSANGGRVTRVSRPSSQ